MNEPTVQELAKKALEADVIDRDFALDLLACDDLEEAMGMFYTYGYERSGDPEVLLLGWGLIE